ncbi:MAG: EamA family transporter [Candidatus Baltobacteraceae bacterium]
MPRPLSVALALAAVYVLWGSTAPAMRVAVATLSPWWMAAIRFSVAGGLLWIYSRARGAPLPRKGDWLAAALTGFILLVLGNSVFAWCLQYIPSGIGSLFFALSPMWMAILGFFMYGERLSLPATAGLLLGLAGMIYLYSPSGAQDLPLLPTVLGVFSSMAWALGSVIQRRFTRTDYVQMSGMQMLAAAAMLYAFALLSRAPLGADSFAPGAIWGLVYLIFFGSIVGFSAYLWLMRHVPTTLASTYSYVNPVVSLCVGVGLLHERLDWNMLLGAAVILAGVALMMTSPKRAANA